MSALHERDISALADSLGKSNLDGSLPTDLVDTCAAVADLLDTLIDLPKHPPSIYIDLEGIFLSRHGSVSILQIHVASDDETYLIDVHTLGKLAFSTSGSSGQTLKDILESDSIPKVFFDVRNDSDALYSHFGISLANVWDLQLMELATRNFSKRRVSGLSKCIERDLVLSAAESSTWTKTKEKGLDLFAPERGGSYQVFNVRPLTEDLVQYCVQDVHYMPKLWKYYNSRMTVTWKDKVRRATRERIALSQTATFNGKGQHMALAPPGWY